MAKRGLSSMMKKGLQRGPAVTEDELLTKDIITPADCMALAAPTSRKHLPKLFASMTKDHEFHPDSLTHSLSWCRILVPHR